MRRAIYIGLSLALVLCLVPVGLTAWAAIFADRHGCELNEGGIHPCIVDGTDWGETLYVAATMGWFGIITLPFAALAAAGLVLLALVDFLRYLWPRR